MKTRFAPSPTGLLHLGNVRTALFNYLLAKKSSGSFLLRIEDTDQSRSTKVFYKNLLNDLTWLGIQWQEGPFFQSRRTEIYAGYFKKLTERNCCYQCFCSEEQLAITRKAQLANGQPPRYPGTCRNLNHTDIQKKLYLGSKPVLRFKVSKNKNIVFDDLIKGKHLFKMKDIGDFIIRRQNCSASFIFCNAIDDAEMDVTHTLRGDDHLTNTAKQIAILQELDLPIPYYGHFPMVNGENDSPLSKRNGSESLQFLRKHRYLPLAIVNYLARLGHYYQVSNLLSLDDLALQFSLKYINTAPARHDNVHLKHWQKKGMLKITHEAFSKLIWSDISKLIPYSKKDQFFKLILPNILMPCESIDWAHALFDNKLNFLKPTYLTVLQRTKRNFFEKGLELLGKKSPIDFKTLTDELKKESGLKGKELFMPLRIALTGKNYGPELLKIVSLMCIETVKLRFQQAIAIQNQKHLI